MKHLLLCCVAVGLLASVGQAADKWGLKEGPVKLQSASTLAFGPDGILFVGDTRAAAVVAISTGDSKRVEKAGVVNVEDISKLVGGMFDSPGAKITDVAVNPLSKNVYLSISIKNRGALVKLTESGKMSLVSLKDVAHSRVDLPGAP